MYVWLSIASLPRTSFYEWKLKLKNYVDKDHSVKMIIKKIFTESKGTYGSRRIKLQLAKINIIISRRKIVKLMKSLDLICEKFKNRIKKYNSYKGDVGKKFGNELNRGFDVNAPNKVWVTDVTEFKIKNSQTKVYLSAILDLYNREIVGYSLHIHPTISFTNKSLDRALKKAKTIDGLMIHSDQGAHYQHCSWTEKLKKLSIKQSMSRKGNCLDNAVIENFFSILKQEMYYGENFYSVEELMKKIRKYIKWYNEKRIKAKLNGMSPIEYRLQHSA